MINSQNQTICPHCSSDKTFFKTEHKFRPSQKHRISLYVLFALTLPFMAIILKWAFLPFDFDITNSGDLTKIGIFFFLSFLYLKKDKQRQEFETPPYRFFICKKCGFKKRVTD